MHSPTSPYISVHLHVSRHISQAGLPRGEGNWLQLARRIAQACGGQMLLVLDVVTVHETFQAPCTRPVKGEVGRVGVAVPKANPNPNPNPNLNPNPNPDQVDRMGVAVAKAVRSCAAAVGAIVDLEVSRVAAWDK